MISASRNKNNKKIERDRSQEIKIKIKKEVNSKKLESKKKPLLPSIFRGLYVYSFLITKRLTSQME